MDSTPRPAGFSNAPNMISRDGGSLETPRIAVVIPCYRVSHQVVDVIRAIGPECSLIFVVDDCCPEDSGRLVESTVQDPRVQVIYHTRNLGVGGAVMTGYRAALAAGADIVVKVDGDGQMDPRLVPQFVAPLLRGEADYTKGNRFYSIYNVRSMPAVRLFGNAVLSFVTKLSSGYWHIFDPTNGYTAAHAAALRRLEMKNISERYFFETDMLVNLGGIRAVVQDIPMEASYGTEKSSLHIRRVIGEFLWRHMREFTKRIVYGYFLRDFNLASLNLLIGFALMAFGSIFGGVEWAKSISSGHVASAGTVILAALPVILGLQLLLNFVSFDMSNEPTVPIQRLSEYIPVWPVPAGLRSEAQIGSGRFLGSNADAESLVEPVSTRPKGEAS